MPFGLENWTLALPLAVRHEAEFFAASFFVFFCSVDIPQDGSGAGGGGERKKIMEGNKMRLN